MPVIAVSIPSTLLIDRLALLSAINAVAAGALGLASTGIHSQLSLVETGCTGQTENEPWPVALLQGRRRDTDKMNAAVEGVAGELARLTKRDREIVWVQWLIQE